MIIVPIILAGGVGERFWPLSRSSHPKQLLAMISRRSMIEETLLRVRCLTNKKVRPLIVTSAALVGRIRRVVPLSRGCAFLAEPAGKNTAPAVAIAAVWVLHHYGKDAVMAVLPADHAITPVRSFVNTLRRAARIASIYDRLVVFGVRPLRADTGYGYIEVGALIPQTIGGKECFAVKRFVEKPNQERAKRFLRSRRFLWNSGMFVWKASVILEELQQYLPELHAAALRAAQRGFTSSALAAFYRDCAKESIDYAVMERTRRAAVICCDFKWDDVGSWDALSRLNGTPAGGVTVQGDGVYTHRCSDSIVVNRSFLHLCAVGLKNVALIVSPDAVLAIDRSFLPELKKHLSAMKNAGFPSVLF